MMGPPKGQSERDKTPGIFLLAAQDIFRCLNSKDARQIMRSDINSDEALSHNRNCDSQTG
eukprot:4192896-Amphidinium_carterae.2